MPSWHVRLFGQFEFTRGDISCDLPASNNARALLAYLLLHKGRLIPRSTLAELVAPEASEEQARRALSQALWHVRRCLPELLHNEAGQVGIVQPVEIWVDALEFQTLAEQSLAGRIQPVIALTTLRQAVDLYRSDLLEGYYDEWVLIERERLRDLYLRVLESLVIAYKTALQYQHALSTALRLTNADPLNENAHREVIRLYHYLGCPVEALRQYETCCEILRREFNLEPEAETIQLAQTIAIRSGETPAPHLPEPLSNLGGLLGSQTRLAIPLVGRNVERNCLVDWLKQGRAMGGSLVLLEGEAGMGKTRLLQEVARDLEWHGAQVLWGKAIPLTETRPLEPLINALDNGLNPLRVEQLQHLVEPVWLMALEPVLPKVAHNLIGLAPLPMLEGWQARIRLLEGLVHLLAAWAQINPLVIIVEDVHWADADTLDILMELAPRLEHGNVSLVLSYRNEDLAVRTETREKIASIQPEMVRGRLALEGLDATAVHELIRASLGAGEVSESFEKALFRETGGNPLFILELLLGLYDEGVLRRNESGEWNTPYDSALGDIDLPLPPVVEQVIVHRLEQLPEDLRSLLGGLAVLGGELTFNNLANLGLADAPTLVGWMQEFTKRRLLTETSRAYRFSHDKIRQVVYESLDPAQRIAWHARLATALEQTHPDEVETLAHHYTLAQSWEKAVEYHRRSAEKAMHANAYATALEHLNRTLTLADRAGLSIVEQFRILVSHVEIVEVLGDMQLFQQDLDAMQRLAGSDPGHLAQTRQKQVEFLLQTHRYVEAENAARQVLDLAVNNGDLIIQAAALNSLGNILDVRGDLQGSLKNLKRAIELYQQLGDRHGEADARGHLANVLAKSGQRAVARAEFEAVLSLYEDLNYQPGCADTLAVLGVLSDFDGDYESTLQYCGRALELCRAIGYRTGEAYVSHEMGSVLINLGRIGESIHCLRDTLEVCRAINEQRIEAVTHSMLSRIYCDYVGDYASAIREAEAGQEISRLIADPILDGISLNHLGNALLKAGKVDEAKVRQEQSLAIFQANNGGLRLPLVYLSLVCIYLHESQPQAAQENLDLAETYCQKYGLDKYNNIQLHLRAEILLALDRAEEALECTNRCISNTSDAHGTRYGIYYLHYKILNRLGFSAEARQALELAYQNLTRMLAGLSPEQQAISRQQVEEHRLILEIWQAFQPRRIEVRLPSANAPLGRPPRPEEWVTLHWTVAAPEDDIIYGKVDRRRRRLLRLLREAADCKAAPTSEQLAQALGVSVRTIAGDLTALKTDHNDLLQATLRGRQPFFEGRRLKH